MKNYLQAEKVLQKRKRLGIQLGLGRFAVLLAELDNPQKKFKAIQVAGTNGKGSVCAITEAVLREAGCRTGLYTSPHFFEYRERIRLNSKIVSQKDFARYFFEVLAAAEKIEKASQKRKLLVNDRIAQGKVQNRKGGASILFTEFELLTAAAFLCFAENKVRIAVLETGLGGRLDATTLCEPIVTAITRIGLDHAEFLGNSLPKIAAEKAGIIKPRAPVIAVGDPKTSPIIKKIADVRKTPVFLVDSYQSYKSYSQKSKSALKKYFSLLSLQGEFQKENLSLVLKIIEILNRKKIRLRGSLEFQESLKSQKVLKISRAVVEAGLKKVNWPGRFQTIHENPVVIADGGHNPQAAAALAAALKKRFPDRKIIFIVGILRRKDFRSILKTLAPLAEKFILIDDFDEPSWSAAEMGAYLKNPRNFKNPEGRKTVFEKFSSKKFRQSLSLPAEKQKVFCFTGSLKTAAFGLEFFKILRSD